MYDGTRYTAGVEILSEKDKQEIRKEYKEAKFPAVQIGILADLHCVCKDAIKEVVGLKVKKQKQHIRYNGRAYSEEIKSKIVEEYFCGETQRNLAAKYNVNKSSIQEWIKEKEKQYEVV